MREVLRHECKKYETYMRRQDCTYTGMGCIAKYVGSLDSRTYQVAKPHMYVNEAVIVRAERVDH